ncbi:hypothetical protein HZB93_00895 [Candidatus Falkowbacteria bacterium]|nr:hypothetical protein [Candidatus Falkowbacteria bacterium]
MKRLVAVVLAALIGCGGQAVQSPVDIEVVEALYVELSLTRIGVALCLTSRSVEWSVAIDPARSDVRRLRDEYGVYYESDRTGAYCGPVCQEMQNFLAEANQAGLISCEEKE